MNKYRLSFTSGALLYSETVAASKIFADCRDLELTKRQCILENISQSRTETATRRTVYEIMLRLRHLGEEGMLFLADDIADDIKKQIVWLAVCKTYPFIAEFCIEVMHSKLTTLDFSIVEKDYDRYFNSKVQWHPELDKVSETTQYKIKQVLFRMLRQVGFLGNDGEIIQTTLSAILLSLIAESDTVMLRCFPSNK